MSAHSWPGGKLAVTLRRMRFVEDAAPQRARVCTERETEWHAMCTRCTAVVSSSSRRSAGDGRIVNEERWRGSLRV